MVPEVVKENPSTGTVKRSPSPIEPRVTGRLSKVTIPADADAETNRETVKVLIIFYFPKVMVDIQAQYAIQESNLIEPIISRPAKTVRPSRKL